MLEFLVRRGILSVTTPVVAVAAAGLLDNFTVGAAYSVRQLRTAYTDDLVRIRRSSDNTEQDFGFDANGDLDVDAIDSFLGGSNGFIVTWYDQSGNGLDVTQSTAANQPLFVAVGIGGKPTIRFDGSNDLLQKTSVGIGDISTGPDQITVMFVLMQDGSQSDNTAFSWGGATGGSNWVMCHPTVSDTVYWDYGGFSVGRVSAAQPSGWDDNSHIVELFRQTDDTQAIIVDGTSLVSGSTSGAPSGTATLELGANNNSSHLKGDISELFILKTDIGA